MFGGPIFRSLAGTRNSRVLDHWYAHDQWMFWQDYNMMGHQLVVHEVTKDYRARDYHNPVGTNA